jgi:hypothetical protein
MQTLTDSTPTGAIYGVHASRETRAELLTTIDVENLVGALVNDPLGHTEVTPLHAGLLVAPASTSRDVMAYPRGRVLLVAYGNVFESTPSAIEQARVRTLPTMPEAAGDPPAYEAFKALGRWLDADDGAVADMIRVGRTTPYTWKRDGREPRPATAQRVYEHHATLDALRRRLGIAGLRRWLHEGVAPRRDTLLAGDLEHLDGDVHAVLFSREPTQRIDLAAAPQDSTPAEVMRGERQLRPSGRRPRRSGR